MYQQVYLPQHQAHALFHKLWRKKLISAVSLDFGLCLFQFLEKCKSTHALGRVGDVSEVAKAIAFLASDDSSFITGTHVPVDGGRHVMCPR